MDYIEIQGFKSIKYAKVELGPINILIGSNGAGKSNFLSFFEFLNRLYERKLSEYIALRGGEEKLLHKGSAITNQISFKTEFKDGQNGYSATIEKGDEGFIFKAEHLIYRHDEGWDISNYKSEAQVKVTDNYRAKYVIRYLNSFRKYHFHDTGKNSPFSQLSHIENDSYFLYEKGENLAAFLYNIRLRYQLVYNRIVNTIQSIAPFFSDFYFQPNEEGFIRLQWQDKYSSTIYGVNDLSDGTIRFIALTTLFLQPTTPSSIIIDEPELGLHPFAISKLAGMVHSVASRGVQVIAATQSSDLINHFKAEDILTIDQKNGESIFNRLSADDLSLWLDDYSIGDLWQRNIVQGGQPN
jgi:predicted ATPase